LGGKLPECDEIVRVLSHVAQTVGLMLEAGKVKPETAAKFFENLRQVIRELDCTDAMWKYREIIKQL
jgi:hypothetical protein